MYCEVPDAWQEEVRSIDRTALLRRYDGVWAILSRPEYGDLSSRKAKGRRMLATALKTGNDDPVTLGMARDIAEGYGVAAIEQIPDQQVPLLIAWFREATFRMDTGNVDAEMDATEANSDGRAHEARRNAKIQDYVESEVPSIASFAYRKPVSVAVNRILLPGKDF